MCQIKEGFKLCTCGDIRLVDADWILERINLSLPNMMTIGEYMPSLLDNNHEKDISYILNELNTRNCFDFQYSPDKDDFLSIRLNKATDLFVHFRFSKKGWIADEGVPFDDWKQKLDALNHGVIK